MLLRPTNVLLFAPLTALALAFGCATILGVEDLKFGDAGMPLVTEDGSVIVVPPGPPECDADDQCKRTLDLVPLVDAGPARTQRDAGDGGTNAPKHCATVQCLMHRCVLFARDDDGDMLTTKCESVDPKYPVQRSERIDCDDTQPGVVTDSLVDCTDGTYALPALGECRPGKARCLPDGTFGSCDGGVAPKPETCDQKDQNCNGPLDEGVCACAAGATRPCGLGIDAGICRDGTQQCGTTGWQGCDGGVFPHKKTCNGQDNDCNGVIDDDEPYCNPPRGKP
jgi:Putative metal-binding motif